MERTHLILSIALILSLAALSCVHVQTPPPPQIVGTWRLIEYWNRDSEDQPKRFPYGEQPLGLLVYDAAGNMLVELAKNPQPPRLTKDALNHLPSEELQQMLHEFVAYFGTYTLDTEKNVIVHHVTADLRREYTETDQARPFRIEGDELILGDGRTWLRRFKREHSRHLPRM